MGGKSQPTIKEYFEALKAGFEQQERVLTRVLPHWGEQGRNNEEFLKAHLRRLLPKKFSLGTGFIICSDPQEEPSRQQDVVIYDEFHNSPIFQEYAASIFPIESVYATIEVKTTLRSGDLDRCIESIAQIRRMANAKSYLSYSAVQKGNGAIAVPTSIQQTLPPRSYIFAYSADDAWASEQDVKSVLEKKLTKGAHLHGLLIARQGWFFSQEAYADGVAIHTWSQDAFLQFSRTLLHGISSIDMRPADIDRYVR